MLNYIFRKTNYHKIEIVIRNSRRFQNLHKSGAEKKNLGYKRFEIPSERHSFYLLFYIFQNHQSTVALKALKVTV